MFGPSLGENRSTRRHWAGYGFVQGKLTREQIIEQTTKPFAGKSEKGVDRTTLNGKVMCGYHGWHSVEGDGLARMYHWTGRNGFKPDSTNVDLWPDVPVGPSKFATFEGLPSDHYLKLVGAASKMIRGDIA